MVVSARPFRKQYNQSIKCRFWGRMAPLCKLQELRSKAYLFACMPAGPHSLLIHSNSQACKRLHLKMFALLMSRCKMPLKCKFYGSFRMCSVAFKIAYSSMSLNPLLWGLIIFWMFLFFLFFNYFSFAFLRALFSLKSTLYSYILKMGGGGGGG
jgi:hypothetical protein